MSQAPTNEYFLYFGIIIISSERNRKARKQYESEEKRLPEMEKNENICLIEKAPNAPENQWQEER